MSSSPWYIVKTMIRASGCSLRIAGIILVVVPTIEFGGYSLLRFIAKREPGYLDNAVRRALFTAGHAHAGVYLVLSLVMLRYVDEAALSPGWKQVARLGAPIAAIFIPAAFFFSTLSPTATTANGFINLAYVGALALAVGVLTLGIGLIRAARTEA